MKFTSALEISTGDFDWRGQRVLVTGGAGFIGSYLVEDLVHLGARVRVADDLSSGSMKRLASVAAEVDFVSGDLTDRGLATIAVKGCDVVFHLAAKAFGMLYSMAHNYDVLRDNVAMTLNVLDACVDARTTRTLMVSSSCVYDDDAPTPTPEIPVHLGVPESGNEGYGWSKRFLEIQTTYAHQQMGLPAAIVRPFNAYGGRYAWQGDASHVVPSLVKKVLDKSGPVEIWGSGKQVRDLLHARDFALGFRLIAERITNCEVFNLAGGETITLTDLVARIGSTIGIEPEVVFDTSKGEGRLRKEADLTRLHSRIPEFRPTVSLEDGLRDMVDWYEAGLSGWASRPRS